MKQLTAIVAAIAAFSAVAQPLTNSISTVTSGNRQVTVTAVAPTVFKVTNAPVGATIPDSRLITAETPAADLAKAVDIASSSTVTTMSLNAVRPMTATLVKRSGAVAIDFGNGVTIVDNGLRAMTDSTLRLSLAVPPGSAWYGGGERGHSLNLAGDTLTMYNRPTYGYGAGDSRISQMNITMPIVYSSQGYALIFDDYAASKLILSDPIEYITESTAPLTYYVVAPQAFSESTLASVQLAAAPLIGLQPIPPLWTLGYINSKYGYKSPAETLEAVEKLKKGGYPLDGVVLDLYWFGKEEDMGRLAWDMDNWADYKEMISSLRDQNVSLVTISEPYVLRNGLGADNYAFFAENSMLVPDSLGRPGEVRIWVGEGGMLDFSNPATRSWLADFYKNQHLEGVTAFWGDLGEPEIHPDSLIHYNGLPARLYHNYYGNDWASIISEMMKKEFPEERSMILMRAGTIGLQRHGVMPWSGDVSRSWEGLQAQIPIMINSSLSGLGYMSHDVGGFAVDPENPIDPELYVRWLQMGLYTPVFRTHAQLFAEPFNYPELEKEILLPLIRERYDWLPYNYSIAIENSGEGLPFVRPINYFNPDFNEAADSINDQYLWGEAVMVAPVLEKGARSRKVVFPGKTKWFDLDNRAVTYSDTTVTIDAPLDRIPRFISEGHILPTAGYAMTSTADYRTDRYRIDIFPISGGTTHDIFYEDDLKTPGTAFENGVAAFLFEIIDTDKEITIDWTMRHVKDSDKGFGPDKKLTFNVYGIDKKPKGMTGPDGRKIGFKYDKKTRSVEFSVDYAPTANDVKYTIIKK